MLISSERLEETANRLRRGSKALDTYLQYKAREIGVKEVQIKALLPEKNRFERLQQQAARLQEQDPVTEERPSLYGILVGVKDLFHLENFPTRAGSRLPPELLTGEEGKLIADLKDAGALMLGKTVTTEFAYFAPGPTRNPHNPGHTPGGSSSGSAAAVAAGYCPLALGTQTIGSVIRPAAFCGIVGFKPSFGRIPTEGLLLFSPSADHAGLFTQNMAGMRLAARLACQNWRESEESEVDPETGSSPVLGIPVGSYLKQTSSQGKEIFDTQLKFLSSRGYELKEVEVFAEIKEINRSHNRLIAREFAEIHASWYREYADSYRQTTAELIETGQQISDKTYRQDRNRQAGLRSELQEIMQAKKIDLWISPPAPGPAPEGLESTGDPVMNLPWTSAGLPAVNLPAGKFNNDLPAGLQLVGNFTGDEELLVWSEKLFQDLEELEGTILQ